MPDKLTLGSRGVTLIKSFEGFRLSAYLPTPNDVPTIGFGHTEGVKLGDTCTREQAENWFHLDVSSSVRTVLLTQLALNIPLTQSMFDALVSLVFNVGSSCLGVNSTIRRALAAKDYYSACQGFFLWRKQGKTDLLGLARRRVEEMSLFLEDGIPKK